MSRHLDALDAIFGSMDDLLADSQTPDLSSQAEPLLPPTPDLDESAIVEIRNLRCGCRMIYAEDNRGGVVVHNDYAECIYEFRRA
jgi:hypothetical protein